MKTFILKEASGDKYEDYLGEEKDNKIEIKLHDVKKFNYIVLVNPEDSKHICVINNMILGLKDTNRLCFLPDDSSNAQPNIKYAGVLKIMCRYKNEDKINSEYESHMIFLDKPLARINGKVFILIPGGSLLIRLEKAIMEANLCIDCNEQEI